MSDLPDIELAAVARAAEEDMIELMIDMVQQGDHVKVDPMMNRNLIRDRVRRRIRLMATLVEQCNELDRLVSTSAKDPK
jgi:hypothetical protein